MSREILFRGKRVDNGEWVYGSYVICLDEDDHRELHLIIPPDTEMYRFDFSGGCYVTSESVGQFTGLTDKNGKKIFEGDIVAYQDYDKLFFSGVVEYLKETAMFVVRFKQGFIYYFMSNRLDNVEVIGNIFDNAELLQEK